MIFVLSILIMFSPFIYALLVGTYACLQAV
jgi:hypothetical protein